MGDELFHYGIKGQKWGIRRFQNEDGTLTSAGEKRYGESDGSSSLKRGRDYKGTSQKAEKHGSPLSGGPVGASNGNYSGRGLQGTIGSKYYQSAYDKWNKKTASTALKPGEIPWLHSREYIAVRDAINNLANQRGNYTKTGYTTNDSNISSIQDSGYAFWNQYVNAGSGDSPYNDAQLGMGAHVEGGSDAHSSVATVVLGADTPMERIALKEGAEAKVGGIIQKVQSKAVNAIVGLLTKNKKVAKAVNSFLSKHGF